MSDLSKCKSLCASLNTCCHNTKNRVIEKSNPTPWKIPVTFAEHVWNISGL